MFLWKTIDIADHERALLYRRKRLVDVLTPGHYRLSQLHGEVAVETFDVTEVKFEHSKGKFLAKNFRFLLSEHVNIFETGEQQVGLLYRDNVLAEVLPPASFLMTWKGVEDVKLTTVDISNDYQVPKQWLTLLGHTCKADPNSSVNQAVLYVEVQDEQVGLLTVNGKLVEVLQPGAHGFWRFNRNIEVEVLDLRLQAVNLGSVSCITLDHQALRLTVEAMVKIEDVATVVTRIRDLQGWLKLELQQLVQQVVSTKTLVACVEDSFSLTTEVLSRANKTLPQYGLSVSHLVVSDALAMAYEPEAHPSHNGHTTVTPEVKHMPVHG